MSHYTLTLFVFSLAVNLVCFNWSEAPIVHPDSPGYMNPAEKLMRGQLPNFTLRSPTYPMYLLVANLFGQIFDRPPLEFAVYGQMVLGAIALVLLYLICLKLLKSERLAFGASALLALNYGVISYQAAVLTETLSVTLVMAVLYAHISVLNQQMTWERLGRLIVIDSLLVMLRPNFALLPASLYTLQLLHFLPNFRNTPAALKPTASCVSILLVGIFWSVGLVATWSVFYYLQTGYFGLSRTSDLNLAGKAIQYGYFDRVYNNPPEIVQRAQDIYREEGRPKDPYVVINRLRQENLYDLGNMRRINSYLFSAREIDFAIQTARLFPKVLNTQGSVYYGRPHGLSQNSWLRSVTQGFNSLHLLNTAAILYAVGYSLYLFAKQRREQYVTLMMILTSILYHLVIIAAFGYSEYSRLRVPIDLLLNLLVLLPFILLAFYLWQRLNPWVSTLAILRAFRRAA